MIGNIVTLKRIDPMQRRKFIALLVSVAAPWPLIAHAPQPRKMWRIGLITHSYGKYLEGGLFDGLRELGYVEGQNIIIERRYAEGNAKRAKLLGRGISSPCPSY
jgi:putative ABC transport system substrate-binding protein